MSSGILLSIDFRKAFDTLEWPIIHRALETYNFGQSLKRWIEIFYKNIVSAVRNNGYPSKWIKPSRGGGGGGEARMSAVYTGGMFTICDAG